MGAGSRAVRLQLYTERHEGTGKMMDKTRWHTVVPTAQGWVLMYDGGAGLEPMA